MNWQAWIRRLILFLLLGAAPAAGGWQLWRARTADTAAPAIPAEVVAKPGRLTVIRAESAPARVLWHACPAAQPPDLLPLEEGRALVFVASQPGRYELIAWSAAGGQPTDAAKCVVRVEPDMPPTPPDALTAKLRAAWAKETSPQRDHQRELLAGLYQAAAEDTVKLANLHTIGDLFATVRQAAKTLMPDDALAALRAGIADELRSTLPTDSDAQLDDGLRRKCGDAFRRIADALNHL